MKQNQISASFVSVTMACASSALGAITIPTVAIGNPGNAADPSTGSGSVAYLYNIGSTEVTNTQYAAFLNAVASTDTNNLYIDAMAQRYSGITRTGSSGFYTYAAVDGRANNPVNFVNISGAMRFANWMHNGQPTGAQNATTTEDGAYTLTRGDPFGRASRNTGWRWAVTSENEWYKAAYHQPAAQGGDGDNYWFYPTSRNTITPAQANYLGSGVNNTLPVGSYAPNFYGALDMGGNLAEWLDTTLENTQTRRLRGGSFGNSNVSLQAGNWFTDNSTSKSYDVGFRLVMIPAPSALALLPLSGLMIIRRRRY
jgi:formylglycine-generating enzyme required for sulfatase activity